MYEEYFGLTGSPFRLNPDPKFFFGSRSHNKAMAYLHYGVKQAEGFIVITGPVGAGKTMLIGHLLDQLNRSNVVAAQLLTSNIEPEQLLSHILSAFRIEPECEGRTGELEAFEDYLFDQLNRGRRVLLIMDEAQNLPVKTLEELRMLSNIDYDGTPLFQVFLVGQPEFRETMTSPSMEQLKQRVIASYHLENLTEEETREYILHRLSVTGWKNDPVFKDDAIKAVFKDSGGRPRRINTLCNRVMLYCALEQKHEVTGEIVKKVVAEMREEKLRGDEGEAVAVTEAPAAKAAAKPASRVVSEPRGSGEIMGKGAMKKIALLETGSVFDRLRARRAGEEIPEADAPHEATLTEVASAIAAATAGELPPIEENYDEEEAELPPIVNEISSERRKSIVRTISETRDELKEAHSSVKRLRHSLLDMQKKRNEKNALIAASFERAQSLLGSIRDAWR